MRSAGGLIYMGRLELEFPTSSSLRSFGLRPSAFVDIGSVWGLRSPRLNDIPGFCSVTTGTGTGAVTRSATLVAGQSKTDCLAALQLPAGSTFNFAPGFRERFVGNSPKPRLSVGVGVNWVSPFGPLRIDLAKAILKQEGDDTKLFSFNVGTQF